MKVHGLIFSTLIMLVTVSYVVANGKETRIGSSTRGWISDFFGGIFNAACRPVNEMFPAKFVLYKSDSEDSWTAENGDSTDFYESLDPEKEIVFIIPGFLRGCDRGFVTKTKAAYLEHKPNVQVVTVCWSSAFPNLENAIGYPSWLTYPLSYALVPCTGQMVAAFLEHLNRDFNVPWENLSIVSHSLGSHVAGAAGIELNGKLRTLIALDPSRTPMVLTKGYLNKDSADRVIVLHTSVTMAPRGEVGTVDFYANNGKSQPGCKTPSCSHYRSVKLFIESLKNEKAFKATKCSNYNDYNSGRCHQNPETYFTDDTNAIGFYFFDTRDVPPFSLSKADRPELG